MQLYLANKVAELLVKDHPEIRLTTLVYGSASLKIEGITAHPNVVLFLAPIGARFNKIKMLVPLNENSDVEQEIDNCFKVSDNIYFWDYLEATDMPFPGIDQYIKSVRYLADILQLAQIMLLMGYRVEHFLHLKAVHLLSWYCIGQKLRIPVVQVTGMEDSPPLRLDYPRHAAVRTA